MPNYSKQYKGKQQSKKDDAVVEEVVAEEPVVEEVVPEKETAPVVSEEDYVVACHCRSLNVRVRPERGAPILFVVKNGDRFIRTKQVAGWTGIADENTNRTGYVMSEFVKDA